MCNITEYRITRWYAEKSFAKFIFASAYSQNTHLLQYSFAERHFRQIIFLVYFNIFQTFLCVNYCVAIENHKTFDSKPVTLSNWILWCFLCNKLRQGSHSFDTCQIIVIVIVHVIHMINCVLAKMKFTFWHHEQS